MYSGRKRESVCENGYDLILAFTITRNRRNRYRFVSWLTESNHFFDWIGHSNWVANDQKNARKWNEWKRK